MSADTILVADDSATVRLRLKRTLSQAGYDVELATNGMDAIGRIRRNPAQLAILDINMPYLDGYAVCQQMQHMGEPWSTIPVIFLTVDHSKALEVLGEQLGGYFRKPVNEVELLKAVRHLIDAAYSRTALATTNS